MGEGEVGEGGGKGVNGGVGGVGGVRVWRVRWGWVVVSGGVVWGGRGLLCGCGVWGIGGYEKVVSGEGAGIRSINCTYVWG